MTNRTAWWRVSLPYATFGIRFEYAVVVEAAPIARWMIGKQYEEVYSWVQSKGGTMQVLLSTGRP